MTSGIRGKYILSFFVSAFFTIIAAEIYLEYNMGDWLGSQLVADLRRHANTGSALVEAQENVLTRANMAQLAKRLGRNPELRVTLIAADGQVLGDSQLDDAALRVVENHGQRPEVLEALQNGFGQNKHYSIELSQYMLYVAVPFHHPISGIGVVRVAMAMKGVQSVQDHLHLAIIVSGLIAIVTAISLGGFSAHWATRSQRHIIAYAENMAQSVHASPIQLHDKDSFSGLARFVNLLVHEKKETLAQLSEQRSQMAAVLQSMGEGVIALDGQRCITLMNRSVLELLRLPHPLLGQPARTCLPYKAHAALKLDQDCLPNEPFSAEFDLGEPTPRRMMGVVTPLYEHEGHVIVLRDITEKRRLETAQRDFVANVSHELRTPISVIQANAQTLLDGVLSDDAEYSRELIDAMERNASRLGRLISDLLDLSRLDADQLSLERNTLFLLPIVQDAAQLIQETADDKQISLQVDIAPELSVYTDAEVLHRILTNLLTNAVKYIPDQSRILVRTRTYMGGMRLEVVDNGPGIAPQHRSRLFERFYRVDSGRSRKMGGTGLGLAIVKYLAEKMGETVGMEAVEPQGSLFWVTMSPVSTQAYSMPDSEPSGEGET
ncbi:MAG: hypothetical protein HQL87_10615 [Magnetococcales bacterium]|nr:hypothetical protein [Magnetococcales bacterium]